MTAGTGFMTTGELARHRAWAIIICIVMQVRPEQRGVIPAVTHLDGSAREPERKKSPLSYWPLLDEFEKRTGVPVLMNASFDLRGEVIVHAPTDAMRTLFRSGMDTLVIGSFFVEK